MSSDRTTKFFITIKICIYTIITEFIIFYYNETESCQLLTLISIIYICFFIGFIYFDIKAIYNQIDDSSEQMFKYVGRINWIFITLHIINIPIIKYSCDTITAKNLNYFSLLNIIFIDIIIRFFVYKFYNNNQNRILPSSYNNVNIQVININNIVVNKDNFMDYIKGEILENKIDCSICLIEDEKEGTNIKLDCKHEFHFDCLFECYQHKINKCPICRTEYLKNV